MSRPTTPGSANTRKSGTPMKGDGPDSGRKSGQSPRRSGQSPRGDMEGGMMSPGAESGGSPGAELDDAEPEKRHLVDRGAVSTFFAIAVIANAAFIGMDTQFRSSPDGGDMTAFMQFGEFVFFGIFLVELILRIAADRCPKFLYDFWNLMDAFLVVSSGVDLLFEFLFRGEEMATGDMGKLRAIRLLKVTRLVRMIRVFRVFRFKGALRLMRGLILLIYAILGALRSLGWVMLMFFMATYLGAIITTEFIGLNNDEGDPLLEEWFGDLFKSMFTLVQLATLEDWGMIARYVGKELGGIWMIFFIFYCMATNLILMNVVLATLIENVITLTDEVRDAHAGIDNEDIESWMKTPESLADEEDDEEDKEAEAAVGAQGSVGGAAGAAGAAGIGAAQQSAADRLAMQTLSEFFDLAATYVGTEGLNQRKLVTSKSLADSLLRPDVQQKVYMAVPAMKGVDPTEMSEKIWGACPKHLDKEGMARQELAEACMALKGELSMNHFVVISQALQSMEKHIEHELVHLNKHQRKMNRRFLKLRHRLRKVYHFDGAPRKMVEMMNEMKRKAAANEAHTGGGKAGEPLSPKDGGHHDDAESSDIALSDASSKSEENW